jgi:hypothetical protein
MCTVPSLRVSMLFHQLSPEGVVLVNCVRGDDRPPSTENKLRALLDQSSVEDGAGTCGCLLGARGGERAARPGRRGTRRRGGYGRRWDARLPRDGQRSGRGPTALRVRCVPFSFLAGSGRNSIGSVRNAPAGSKQIDQKRGTAPHD